MEINWQTGAPFIMIGFWLVAILGLCNGCYLHFILLLHIALLVLDRTGQKLNTLELQTHSSPFKNPELRTILAGNRPTNPDPNLEKLNMEPY